MTTKREMPSAAIGHERAATDATSTTIASKVGSDDLLQVAFRLALHPEASPLSSTNVGKVERKGWALLCPVEPHSLRRIADGLLRVEYAVQCSTWGGGGYNGVYHNIVEHSGKTRTLPGRSEKGWDSTVFPLRVHDHGVCALPNYTSTTWRR